MTDSQDALKSMRDAITCSQERVAAMLEAAPKVRTTTVSILDLEPVPRGQPIMIECVTVWQLLQEWWGWLTGQRVVAPLG